MGHTSDPLFIGMLTAAGVGECVSRNEWPPKRLPYFFDNGAWVDHAAGRPYDVGTWQGELARVVEYEHAPDFVVVPDVVADGAASLRMSARHVGRVLDAGLAAYLVLQDGMSEADVAAALMDGYAGLFVGGSLPWKMATAARWCDFAHERELPCHVGRVGTGKRVRWAREIGADSIDSSLPLWSKDKMRVFLDALKTEDRQERLW